MTPKPTTSTSRPRKRRLEAGPEAPVFSELKQPPNAPATRRKSTSLRLDTKRLRNDRLGTLVSALTTAFDQSQSWEDFVKSFRGRSYLSPTIDDLDHPAANLLREWRDEGIPVLSSAEPWNVSQKDEAVRRGCHPSATVHADFLREEMSEFIENKFWVVLPYQKVRDLDVVFSPAAVKDERDRKPRLLCDHSWPWPWGAINDTTLAHAPPEAMQFGKALQRVLQLARHANPKYGAPKASKHDMKDGYYKLFLKPEDCLKLAILLPAYARRRPPRGCAHGPDDGLVAVAPVLLRHVRNDL